MKFSLAKASILLALANNTLAHYIWQSLVVNGVETPAFQYVRRHNNRNNPMKSLTSNDLRCNVGSQSYAAETSTLKIAAGSTLGFALDIDIWHPSVSALYMTKVSKASTADGSTPWFKVYELGGDFSSSTDGQDLKNWPSYGRRKLTFTIPKSLPSGDYLLRAENLALHEASHKAEATEHYVGCAQLTVTGGGSGKPGPTMSIPGGYKASDPGLLFNIYEKVVTSYPYPGPAVWKG
ncbi:hypothetical protein Q7P37_011069 [Cladosporium fusiforme]